ncbi:transposase [Nonomuraea pusilla]|uniref:transposase n=1 Tax=Nonomuraea pusilla TaxID=46177 RepID=UPI003D9F4602
MGGAGAPAAVTGERVTGGVQGSLCWHPANRRALVEAALTRWEAETEQIIAGLGARPARWNTCVRRAMGDGHQPQGRAGLDGRTTAQRWPTCPTLYLSGIIGHMPKPSEVSDELWAMIEPLPPQRQRRFRHPGRKLLDDRPAVQGILFVLHTGITWEHLPQELGYGSGMTCRRRLAEWNRAGVWQRLHEVLLDQLGAADALDLSRAVVDSSQIRASKGGRRPARPPVDRGRAGDKHHLAEGELQRSGTGPYARPLTPARPGVRPSQR